ncbi:iron-sulfur cluster assembly accessory protein [bacterium]|nr:iron-sulfur cluster assembly accessory protein [bacterium]
MITVTEAAKSKIASLLAEDGKGKDAFLRVSVKGGGCSGLMYDLDFDSELKEGDQIFEDNEVKVVVDLKSFLYVHGTILEYSGGLNGKGFVFNNPNATRTCGCGESFAV